MPVLYANKKLIPAPYISISKRKEKDGSGKTLRSFYSVTATGKISADRGSPLAGVTGYDDGVFWDQSGYPPDTDTNIAVDIENRLELLGIKKGAMCGLFCREGQWFEIVPYNGAAPTKFLPRILGINWSQGPWVNYIDYSIEMETDEISFAGTTCCANDEYDEFDPVEESWSIEQADDKGRTYRMTHQVSAQMKDSFNQDGSGSRLSKGWELARDYVEARLGIDLNIKNESNVLENLDDFNAYNYVRSELIDEANGRYSITETWLLYEPEEGILGCIEDFSISTRVSLETGLTSVGIDGTLTGLEERNNTTHTLSKTRWANAEDKWEEVLPMLLSRAQTFSGVTLNPQPLNQVVGKQPLTGIISYNYEYDNRPGNTVAGALVEIVTVNDRYPSDIFARIPVMVRELGPILQDMETVSEKSRTLTVEVTVAAPQYPATVVSVPDVSQYLIDYGPNGAYGFVPVIGPFVESNTLSWSPKQGRLSRSITWIFE